MRYHTTHSIVCFANANILFSLLSDISKWPEIMQPCKMAKVIKKDSNTEIIELTADVNGYDMTWQSKREVWSDIMCIKSDIFKPMEPAEKMFAVWQVYPLNSNESVLCLNHDYDIKSILGDAIPNITTEKDAEIFLTKAIHANSMTELNDIKRYVEKKQKIENANSQCCYAYEKVYPVPANDVYMFLRDTDKWVSLFSNCEKTEILQSSEHSERIKVWGMQGTELINWITKRTYIDDCHRITYYFEKQMPLLSEMHGEWQVITLGENECMLSVKRFWTIRPDITESRQAEQSMFDFVSTNTLNEFESILSELLNTKKKNVFVKTIHIPFEPASVYSFMSNLDKWKKHIPHCESIDIIYDDGENQEFTLNSKNKAEGEAFRSIRKCDKLNFKISYFQPCAPESLSFHSGEWLFEKETEGTKVIVKHEFAVDYETCDSYLDLKKIVKQIQEKLTANSLKTLECCEQYLQKKGQ